MGTLTIPNSIEAGQPRNASPIKENFDAVATVVNGSLDATNLKDSAITTSKLATAAVTAEKLGANVTAQTWHNVGAAGEPAFANSWDNYGGIYGPAQFCKDVLGFVHIAGAVKSGTVAQPIFTLPVGFRPAYREGRMVLTMSSTTRAIGDIQISPTGEVSLAAGGNTIVYLDVTFYAG